MSISSKIRSANEKLVPGKSFFSPEWIVLGVNNICNLHCKMCDVGTKNQSTNFAQNLVGTHPINMPIELIKKIFDDVAEYYPTSKIGYGFTEPLIYPQLIESLEYANQKNLYTSITTNALNLKQKAEGIVNAGLNEIFISLDGLEETHNYVRGHKSSFQRAIAGIQALLALDNPPEISIFSVITNWNQSELVEFAEYFKRFPIKTLGFMHANFTPEHIAREHNLIYNSSYPATASNIDEFDPKSIDIQILTKEIGNLVKLDLPFNLAMSPTLTTESELQTFYHQPEVLIGKSCKDVFRNIMIKSDGSVIPAHGRCYNLNIGNVESQSLKEVWQSKVLSQFKKDISKAGGLFPGCSRCCSAFN